MLLCLSSLPVCAKESEGLPTVSVQQLPPEARQTLVLIYQNGPFPYSRDGTVFGNREKRLPTKPRGHYREYTVPTPGAQNRGARRIVCGGEKPSAPDLCYYTADHYQSFQRIRNETTQP
jgi:ribonuclease T1